MLYRQSIALVGIVLPGLIMALVVGGAFHILGKMKTEFQDKEAKYKIYDQSRIAAMGVEAQIGRKGEHVKLWKEKLAEETRSALSENLAILKQTLPEREFTVTQMADNSGSNSLSGFRSVSAQKSTQISLGFRGTFRSVQRAFLELETRMPQLQLSELKMDPRADTSNTLPSSLLNFDVTYTAWSN